MALEVVGSSPIIHPILEQEHAGFFSRAVVYWDVAKAVRQRTLTPSFRRFESCHPNQNDDSAACGGTDFPIKASVFDFLQQYKII